MDNLVKTISLTIAGAMLSLSVCSAQDSFKARMAREPELATAHYLLYQAPAEKLTPSPKGYRPFYLSHYGRHGSRWLIGPTVYSKPCGLMHSEDEAGNLTALGREVKPSADLRYGHDSAILPLVALMQIGDCGLSTDDLEALTDRWNACDITPMASNLQLVFYRSKKADVLVKILFQEKEMTLPIEAVTGPYYRWSDVKAFWNGILAESPVK